MVASVIVAIAAVAEETVVDTGVVVVVAALGKRFLVVVDKTLVAAIANTVDLAQIGMVDQVAMI